ncbi:MAG TPA: nucleolar RNA-binding Nop10p family protein [Nitrososphaerales archaeon]|nr:nucleolar RNA-binding Nop10p family protein [Nitrososphaerales archaeon]
MPLELKSLLLKCLSCGRYTLAPKCPNCKGDTVTVHPARYSPDDKYARHKNPGAYQESS